MNIPVRKVFIYHIHEGQGKLLPERFVFYEIGHQRRCQGRTEPMRLLRKGIGRISAHAVLVNTCGLIGIVHTPAPSPILIIGRSVFLSAAPAAQVVQRPVRVGNIDFKTVMVYKTLYIHHPSDFPVSLRVRQIRLAGIRHQLLIKRKIRLPADRYPVILLHHNDLVLGKPVFLLEISRTEARLQIIESPIFPV